MDEIHSHIRTFSLFAFSVDIASCWLLGILRSGLSYLPGDPFAAEPLRTTAGGNWSCRRLTVVGSGGRAGDMRVLEQREFGFWLTILGCLSMSLTALNSLGMMFSEYLAK